ncbi:MAG: DUF6261 family protein [Cyclobacteriaceae bacterium]
MKTALLGRYRIQELIQFISNTLMIVKQHGPDKLKIKALYQSLLQQHQNLQQASKQDSMSEITPQLARLDARRDRAIICLRKICGGYAAHHRDNMSNAGQLILARIDKYGSKLYHQNYSAETAALKNLCRELQTDPLCINAVQELNVEEVVVEMNTVNTRFEKLFIQRLQEFSQYEGKSTQEHIQLTSEAYRTLVQHLDAHATLTPSEEYTLLINHLNENIDHFNLMIERRKRGVEFEQADTITDASPDTSVG